MRRSSSLMRRALWTISLVSIVLVLLMTAISYFSTYNREKARQLQYMQSFVKERVRAESEIFQLAERNVEIFKEEFMKLYSSDREVTEEHFWSYYSVDDAGVVRMKREYFDGVYTKDGGYAYGLSSHLGNNQGAEDPELQRRLVFSALTASKLGPAWRNRFPNTHVSYPENVSMLFWPEVPWGRNADANLRINEQSVIRAMTKAANPERRSIWSGLYYDETAGIWSITYASPLDYQGQHLLNPGHDVHLTDLMDRLVEQTQEGIYSFILRDDGYLVAHPNEPDEEQKWIGQLSLSRINIPFVRDAYGLLMEEIGLDFDGVQVVENKAYDSYLVLARIDGPDWLFVRVLPMSVIGSRARDVARSVLVEGVLMLAFILFVILLVMRNQVARPLAKLRLAADAIKMGHYEQVSRGDMRLPVDLNNEIGLLSETFMQMTTSIKNSSDDLHRVVAERTKELERANDALRELSLLDGLTGIHNRRALDKSLDKMFIDAKEGLGDFSVLMADIDLFKDYNDTYGHAAGDEVIKQVALAIRETIREEDRVFRYGGEEFVVVFNQAGVKEAEEAAERILAVVMELNLPHQKSPYGRVTLSGGVTSYTRSFTSSEQLLKSADEKLYRAKGQGRNRIQI